MAGISPSVEVHRSGLQRIPAEWMHDNPAISAVIAGLDTRKPDVSDLRSSYNITEVGNTRLLLGRHPPSRLSVRSCNRLIKPSAPPEAMIEANSSRRVARSLIVPLR
jgi:hypothetical protein